MTSTVEYNNELRTTCVHLQSNQQLITDAPTDNMGKGEAFSPTDLVATGLASCMLTVMGIKANQLDINLGGTKALVEKKMVSNPRRIQQVNVSITFPENNWPENIQKSLQNVAVNCPVAKSLHTEIKQNIQFNF